MTSHSDGQCDRGHDLELVGRDPISGLCNACAATLRRLRSKQDKGPKRTTVDDQAMESIRVHTILELYDQKQRAATPWERDQIQQQINRIR
ncbi:MAG: hypothetical protein GOVbin7015_22 [Prokaryotic dsDNA virus sp.]|jgi:hypothetical protein|nr:MAG: hypothetical protein GOVbin7015_22 [Prokaryotic dsDNA virus sp.]|tara:strand:+ start:2814 stop:3086 length:273 start_codon:yes stop_codon:yes gene_type:complete